MPYEAFWIPGLDTDFDPDEALLIGHDWLQSSSYPGGPVIVLNAAIMRRNRRTLDRMTDLYPLVSPRTRNRSWGGSHAVLAVWPAPQALEVAEEMAAPEGGLCVVPNSRDEMASWMRRTGAVDLTNPNAEPGSLEISPAVKEALDSIIAFDGHNDFISPEGKEYTIRWLRELIASGHRPNPADVEAYALQTGETDHTGAANLRRYYEGILSGRSFRDYRGRRI
jgi:hypothetical protein